MFWGTASPSVKPCPQWHLASIRKETVNRRYADLLIDNGVAEIFVNQGKGGQHFPNLKAETGISYDQMLFFDDCTYGDNCANVASHCPGVTCVRTPHGLTEEDFKLGLEAFAAGKKGVIK